MKWPLTILIVLMLPAVALAGDRPIFLWHGWGVGEIGDQLLLYLGDWGPVVLPIYLTKKWAVAYTVMLVPVVVIPVFVLLRKRRRLRRVGGLQKG